MCQFLGSLIMVIKNFSSLLFCKIGDLSKLLKLVFWLDIVSLGSQATKKVACQSEQFLETRIDEDSRDYRFSKV